MLAQIRHPSSGYMRVLLSDSPRSQMFFTHRLVAEWFLGAQPRERWVVNHKNGDKTDNRLANLEWCSREENQLHAAVLHGHRGEGHPNAKLTLEQVREIRARYTGAFGQQTALAKEFGVTQMLVSKIVRNEAWTHDVGYKPARSPKWAKGEYHGRSKLQDREVRAMRRRYAGGKVTLRELAEQYGVGRQIVRDIVRGKTWRHLLE